MASCAASKKTETGRRPDTWEYDYTTSGHLGVQKTSGECKHDITGKDGDKIFKTTAGVVRNVENEMYQATY